MKATGIVRRIDELGRVVIPKEIRRTLRIKVGDPLEIFTDRDGQIIFKKYSPIGELSSIATGYCDALANSINVIACISDKDAIVAVGGAKTRDFLEKSISQDVLENIENRSGVILCNEATVNVLEYDEKSNYKGQIIVPIVVDSEAIGMIIVMSKDKELGENDLKLVKTVAIILAKQIEC